MVLLADQATESLKICCLAVLLRLLFLTALSLKVVLLLVVTRDYRVPV